MGMDVEQASLEPLCGVSGEPVHIPVPYAAAASEADQIFVACESDFVQEYAVVDVARDQGGGWAPPLVEVPRREPHATLYAEGVDPRLSQPPRVSVAWAHLRVASEDALAARAAAAVRTLLRVAVEMGPEAAGDHVAMSLAKDGLSATTPPTTGVLVVAKGMQYVQYYTADGARAQGHGHLLEAASMVAGTVGGVVVLPPMGARGAPLLFQPGVTTPTDLARVLEAALPSMEAAQRWVDTLANSTDCLLPHLRAAVELAKVDIESATHLPNGVARTTESLAARARAYVLMRALTAESCLPPMTGADLRRLVNFHTSVAMGVAEVGRKPHAHEFGRMLASVGRAQLRRKATRYPFERPPAPSGHQPTVNVAALARMCMDLLGLEDADDSDDPLWTVLDMMFEYDYNGLPPKLQAAMAANGGRTLRFDSAGPPPADSVGPQQAAIDKLVAAGVMEEISEAEATDPSRTVAISSIFGNPTGVYVHSDGAAAAVAGGNVCAMLHEAEQRAARIVAAVDAAVRAGAHAGHAHNAAKAAEMEVTKWRVIFGGHEVGELNQPFNFQLPGWPALLRHYCHGGYRATQDAASYFYDVPYGPTARKCYVGRFGSRYYRFMRMCMGAVDSPGVACMLSSIIVMLARALGVVDLEAYVDDFLSGAPTKEEQVRVLATVSGIMRAIDVEESVAKQKWGTAVVQLGKLVDTMADTVSLPAAKAHDYMVAACTVRGLLAHANPLVRQAVSRNDVGELCGKLGWWAECVLEARCHTAGLYAASLQGNPPPHVQNIRKGVLEDLNWFVQQWARPGGLVPQVIINSAPPVIVRLGGLGPPEGLDDDEAAVLNAAQRRNAPLRAASDAGKVGGGAVVGSVGFYHKWTPKAN